MRVKLVKLFELSAVSYDSKISLLLLVILTPVFEKSKN